MKKINLLEGNITKSLTMLALPIMGMSLLQMAYNLTDIFWIGKLGSGPVASVGTGGILLWLCASIHMLTKIGSQVYVGQSLGAKNYKLAGKYTQSGLILSVIICVILGFTFIFFSDPIIGFFNLNSAQVVKDAVHYMQITGGLVIFSLFGNLITTLLTVTGDSKTPFYATAVGLVFNMVLDPILIFGLFGFPKLGVIGAAIATVASQFIVFILLIIVASKEKLLFPYVKVFEKPNFVTMKNILRFSLPVTIQVTIMPVVSMYLSRLIAGFGDDAVAAQRIGNQIESISWMVSEGFAVAINSFIAQNFGANNIKRATDGFYKALRMMIVYGGFTSCVLMFGAGPIFSLFLNDANTLLIGIGYLQVLGVSQIFMCIEILSSTALNAFGKSVVPSFVSTIGNLIRIPLAMVLSVSVLGITGIWWGITISTILKGLILLGSIIYFLSKLKKTHSIS